MVHWVTEARNPAAQLQRGGGCNWCRFSCCANAVLMGGDPCSMVGLHAHDGHAFKQNAAATHLMLGNYWLEGRRKMLASCAQLSCTDVPGMASFVG